MSRIVLSHFNNMVLVFPYLGNLALRLDKGSVMTSCLDGRSSVSLACLVGSFSLCCLRWLFVFIDFKIFVFLTHFQNSLSKNFPRTY